MTEYKMFKFTAKRILIISFISTAIIMFVLQLWFTANSLGKIREEEMGEAIRSVYWFQNRLVFSGLSVHVGWYSLLSLVYSIFGFSFNTAKFVRLAIAGVSLIALALTFRKLFGLKGLVPLIVIGLSPTFLYFRTLGVQYFLDVDYFVISLFLLTCLDFKSKLGRLLNFFFWFFVMYAWLSYPTFIYYLPALTYWYFLKIKKMEFKPASKKYLFLFASLFSFILPVVITFIYIQNRQALVFDINNRGLFRGAGVFDLSIVNAFKRIFFTIGAFFGTSPSYYYEVSQAEFSLSLPVLIVLFVIAFSFWLLSRSFKYKTLLIGFFMILAMNLAVLATADSFTGYAGVRRASGLLLAFYGLFTLSWIYLVESKMKLRWLGLAILLLLPVHHLLVYPQNLSQASKPSIYEERSWLNIAGTPAQSLNVYLEKLKSGNLTLACAIDGGGNRSQSCRYDLIYSTIAGVCKWNKFKCKNGIYGFDEETNKFVRFGVYSWDTHWQWAK